MMNNINHLDKIEKYVAKKESIGTAKLPLITVIVTNYNYELYLEECLDSVLNIDYPYIQKIIVDDCSTDKSKEIVHSYIEKGFETVFKKKNEGQLAAFFDGLAIANGEFVIFVDADDLVDPDIINAHLSIHLFYKEVVAFSCLRNRQISAEGRLLNNYHSDFQNKKKLKRKIDTQSLHKPFWVWSTTSAMMFRKDVLELIKTKNYQPFRICADYYIVHFANLIGGSVLFDIPMVSYRRHGNNNFSKNMIVGGHKPTGHMTIHEHPEHIELQMEMINIILNNRELLEPYYGCLESYIKLLEKIMSLDNLLLLFDLDQDIRITLEKSVKKIKEKENLKLDKFKLKKDKKSEKKLNRIINKQDLEKEHEVFISFINSLIQTLPHNSSLYIYGTGEGSQLLFQCLQRRRKDIQIIGFIDDFKNGKFQKLDIFTLSKIESLPIIIGISTMKVVDLLVSRINEDKNFVYKINEVKDE